MKIIIDSIQLNRGCGIFLMSKHDKKSIPNYITTLRNQKCRLQVIYAIIVILTIKRIFLKSNQ